MAAKVSPRCGGNLPVEVTSFVGRRHELADVRRALAQFRLVTLIGAGGVGKTRLALRVAGLLCRTFRDGVWLVDVAGLNDPALLTPTVASVLGMPDVTADWHVDRLAEQLADMQVLLVLDNCEHMVAGCAVLIDRLLHSCPQVQALATSRQVLGVHGERVMRVPSLSVPQAERPAPAAEALMGYESVSLLAERAAAVQPGFVVGADNREAVARLCQRLDGIPLAIELAARRLLALSVQQLLDRLEDRYRLLRSGSPVAMPRQQTLRALIDWSFDLLSTRERLLWARLSVFVGGFELDAVEDVCADDALPTDEIAESLAGLVDKSVLIREDHAGRVQYRLLETIREYGRDRLRELGEEAALRRRHRDWYRRMVLQAESDLVSPRQQRWYQWVRAERANLRAAMESYLAEPSAAGDGQRIVAALPCYWIFDGTLGEGRRWLQRLLAVAPTPDADRAWALSAAAWLSVLLGREAEGLALLAESRALAQQLADDTLAARTIHTEGVAAMRRGELSRAVELFEQALAIQRGTGDPLGTVLVLIELGHAWTLLGNVSRAEMYCHELLTLCEARGERWAAAHAWWTLGFIAWRHGNVQRAQELGRTSVRLRQPFGCSWGIVMPLELLTWVAAARGQHTRAARLLGALQATCRSIGVSLPSLWIDYHAKCETEVRNALGRRSFEASFQDGQTLALDEAVSYALGDKPSPDSGRAGRDAGVGQLTRREIEIAQLIAEGLSNKEIAASLVIAPRTAEGHVEHILTKLGFTSRTQVAAWVAGNRAEFDR